MNKGRNLSKAEVLYEKLRTDIINCKYEKNTIINEKAIAEKYNVSKTPIREALTLLVNEGYLVKYPRLGYFIKELKLKEYYQIMQLRFILESGIIRYIISNASDEGIESLSSYCSENWVEYEGYYEANTNFHLAMAKLLDNNYIYDSLNHVFQLNTRNVSIEFYNKVNGDIHQNHRELIKRLKTRDVEGSIGILRGEIQRTDDNLIWF